MKENFAKGRLEENGRTLQLQDFEQTESDTYAQVDYSFQGRSEFSCEAVFTILERPLKGSLFFKSPHFSWESKAVRAPWIDFAVPLVVIAGECVSANFTEDVLVQGKQMG